MNKNPIYRTKEIELANEVTGKSKIGLLLDNGS